MCSYEHDVLAYFSGRTHRDARGAAHPRYVIINSIYQSQIYSTDFACNPQTPSSQTRVNSRICGFR